MDVSAEWSGLARFLVDFGSSPVDVVGGLAPDVPQNYIQRSGSAGSGLSALGLSPGLRYAFDAPLVQMPSVTLVVFSESIGGGNNGFVLYRQMGTSTPSWGLGTHKGSLNGWQIAVNGTGSDVDASPIKNIGAAAASVPAVQVLTVSPGIAKLFVNGAREGGRTFSGGIDYNTAYPSLSVIQQPNGAGSPFRGVVYSVGVLAGAVPDDAAIEVSTNAFQLFRESPQRIYSLPSGPISILRRFDGDAWQPATLRRWNGAAWEPANLRRWNGSEWVGV